MSEDLPPDDGDRLVDQLSPPPSSADAPTDGPVRSRRSSLLIRSVNDRYLAGIAGAVGHRVNVDPFFVRIALVGATLLLARDYGPYAIPLVGYFVGWLVLPTVGGRSLLRRIRDRSALQEIAGAAALLLLSLVVMDRPSLVWAGILLGASVLLLSHRPLTADDVGADALVGPTSDSAGSTATDERSRAAIWGRSLRGVVGPRSDPNPPRPPRVRRPRRSPALWPLTGALLLAYGFGCVLLDNLLDPGLDPGIAVNGALLIIGGVIVLSAWRGRALLTFLLALPLIPAWIAFSLADTPRFAETDLSFPLGRYVDGQVIERTKGYGGISMPIAFGELPPSGEITARVGLTAGQADIWVPKEADLHIIGHVGLGQISVYEDSLFYAAGTYDEPLVDFGLDRRYRALGRSCLSIVTDENGLRNAADWSGVPVATNATSEEVADAIEDAGYPRPTLETVTAWGPWDEVTGEIVYDPDTGLEESGTYQRMDWTYQGNNNAGLCLPQDPPDDPILITIDATVGLGNLKVHRV